MRWIRERLHLWRIDIQTILSRMVLRSPFLMKLARRFPRLAKMPTARLIVHHGDVKNALGSGRSFGVPYLAKMNELGGFFVLGLDEGPEHEQLRDAVGAALCGCDLDALHAESRGRAEALLAGRSRIEIVGDLTDPVLETTVGRHIWSGRVTPRQLDDCRSVFRDIFINSLRDPRVSKSARDAADRLRDHITALVVERDGRAAYDDVLGRLQEDVRLDDAAVVNQAIGVLVAWTASVSRAMAFAMDALFKQPDGFALATAAARDEDRDAMCEVLREAFRFVPPAPAVERVCRREAPIRRQFVRREGDIAAVITSAMMDGTVVEEPGRFRVDRPCADDLTFGFGEHSCLGRDIARAQLSGILIALLRRRDLAWAFGIKLDGPYPNVLEVTWRP